MKMKEIGAVVAVLISQIFAMQSGHCTPVEDLKNGHYDLNPCENDRD